MRSRIRFEVNPSFIPSTSSQVSNNLFKLDRWLTHILDNLITQLLHMESRQRCKSLGFDEVEYIYRSEWTQTLLHNIIRCLWQASSVGEYERFTTAKLWGSWGCHHPQPQTCFGACGCNIISNESSGHLFTATGNVKVVFQGRWLSNSPTS